MDKKIISFSVHIEQDFDLSFWYDKTKQLFSEIGYEYNYFGITSDDYSPESIRTVKRSENRILSVLEENPKALKALEMFSLPKDFKTAVFGYELYICLDVKDASILYIGINKSDYIKNSKQIITSYLNELFSCYSLEIFEMDRDETPMMYAMGCNTPDFYKSLRVIEKSNKKKKSNQHFKLKALLNRKLNTN